MSTDDKLAEESARRNGRRCPFPSYNWYPQDYLSSPRTMRLTAEQHGIYRTLLDHAWLNDGLSMGDLRAIAASLGADYEACLDICRRFFSDDDEQGVYRNDRQEKERAILHAQREKKQAAGRKGAAATHEKATYVGDAVALPGKGQQSLAGASSSPSPLPSPTPAPSPKKSSPRSAPAGGSSNPTRILTDAFNESYERRFGAKYAFVGSKDGKHVQDILKLAGGDPQAVLARLKFAESDPFHANKLRDWSYFLGCWNKLVPTNVVVNGKAWPHESMWRERLRSDDPDMVALAKKKLAEHGVAV